MAIEIIPAEEALKQGRTNREKGYPARGRDENRLLPFAEVACRPTFEFDSDAKVFTAGSCFARNIERSLRKMGYGIVSSDPDFHNPFPDKMPFQRFNKYTIQSILNEIEWALGERPMDSAAQLCEVKDGNFCDLQTSGDSLSAPLDEMVKFRESYNTKFATVAEADVVMLTLGLAESWVDQETGLHLNRFPGATAIRANPGRFLLHVLDHDEIVSALNRTYDVIEAHNPNFRMLVTVSPVPLDRTFRTADILAANCYSKSVQRAAVETFVQTRPVDYFPSYEIVTLTDTAYAWSDHDFRHVRGEMVDRLMGKVLSQYTDVTERQSAQKARGYVTAYLAAGDIPNAEAALNAHVESFDLSLDLMRPAAEIAYRNGDPEEAAKILRRFIAAVDADPEAAEDILESLRAAVLKSASMFLDQCQRASQRSDIDTAEMDRMRAESILDELGRAAPDDENIGWLKSYVARPVADTQAARQRDDDKALLIEAAALARLRGLEPGDVEGAEAIVGKALAELKVSEALSWELALVYRKAERLDEALDLFARVGRMGGAKAVPAVKHALPLARRLKRHAMVADLADDVARAL